MLSPCTAREALRPAFFVARSAPWKALQNMTEGAKNLFDKIWEAHRVGEVPGGQTQLFIGTHLVHEVTSPQAFAMLRELGLPVRFPFRILDIKRALNIRRQPFHEYQAGVGGGRPGGGG